MPNLQPHHDLEQGRPVAIDHVIGQSRAVRQLRTAVDAHFNDRADGQSNGDDIAFPHVLLVGTPGLGKSLFAQIIARELAATLHEELAQNIPGPGSLHALMMLANSGDCVFIDEIHELPSSAQTTLYRCLEERRLFLPGLARSGRQEVALPPFTFIAATTDEWHLNKPLRDRFKITLRLEHYCDEELTQVVKQRAIRLGWSVDDEAVSGIASRSRGTPRLAMRLLEATRRTARSKGESIITAHHLGETCEIEGMPTYSIPITITSRHLKLRPNSAAVGRLWDGHAACEVIQLFCNSGPLLDTVR